MMAKKPVNYHQTVVCSCCGKEIDDMVYLAVGEEDPVCYGCYAEEALDEDGEEKEDQDWRSCELWEYLEDCNDRAYDAYVDRCVDEARDRELFGD